MYVRMKDYIAEFLGTFALVFAITTAIVGTVSLTGTFGILNLIAVALAAGLVLATLIYTFGSASGGHFNPAVTIGLWYAKKFPANKVIPYIVSQLLGAIFASVSLWTIVKSNSLGATTAGTFGTTSAFLIEVFATALFLIVILSVMGNKKTESHAPLAIGFYLLVAHLYAIPFSGASLNPARSLAPALFEGGIPFVQMWIYIAGPIVGALIGAIIFRRVLE